MSDITLCTPDFILQDDHFGMHSGMVPGDGQMMALQVLLGLKRGNYLAYTLKGIDAQTCLELGAVNEIVERDKILDRAWELARMIMKTNRSTRRHDPPHRARGRGANWSNRTSASRCTREMYSFNLVKSQHDFDYIKYTGDKMARM